MPYSTTQVFLRKAVQTFLGVIQANYCKNKSCRNIWNKVLGTKQIQISQICIRKPCSAPEDTVEDNIASGADDVNLIPTVAPYCEYSEHMQGFRVYMDRRMFDSCYEEQMILACLILMANKENKEFFRSICKHSSKHELYKAYPAIHSAVVTISEALKKALPFN